MPASLTIGIIHNRLFNEGVKEYSRCGRHRGFICAWFAEHSQAARLAWLFRPGAVVKRDCGGGWFIVVRFHTGLQTWRS